jgi:hypothetical protein
MLFRTCFAPSEAEYPNRAKLHTHGWPTLQALSREMIYPQPYGGNPTDHEAEFHARRVGKTTVIKGREG